MQLSVIVYQSFVCIYEALIGVISGMLILARALILACPVAPNNIERILYFIREWKTNYNLFLGISLLFFFIIRNHVYNKDIFT